MGDAAVYLDRAKKGCDESFKRLERVPKLIKAKESENLKSLLTLQLYAMRGNMEYITAKGAPGYRNDDETTPSFRTSPTSASTTGTSGGQRLPPRTTALWSSW